MAFDFSVEQTLTFRKILTACYDNPDRGMYNNIHQNSSHKFSKIDFEDLIRIPTDSAIHKFNKYGIQLHDTSQLLEMDHMDFLAQLLDCKFVGPFKSKEEYYKIMTVTSTGEWIGFYICLHVNRIRFKQCRNGFDKIGYDLTFD